MNIRWNKPAVEEPAPTPTNLGLILPPAWTPTPTWTMTPSSLQSATPTLSPYPSSLPALEANTALRFDTVQMKDGMRGWAVTTDGHIVLTSDSGHIWNDVTPPGGTFTAKGFTSVDDTTAYAAPSISSNSQNPVMNGLLWQTRNGGATWEPTFLPSSIPTETSEQAASRKFEPQSIQFIDSNTGWLLARVNGEKDWDVAELFHTVDGGRNWFRQADTLSDDLPHCLENAAFLDAYYGWMISTCPKYDFAPGYNIRSVDVSILVTVDGGSTWATQTHSGEIHFDPFLQGWNIQTPVTCEFSIRQPGRMSMHALCQTASSPTVELEFWPKRDSLVDVIGGPEGSAFQNIGRSDWYWWAFIPSQTGGLGSLYIASWNTKIFSASWEKVQFYCLDSIRCWITAWKAGQSAFLRTSDGGKSWTDMKPATPDTHGLCATGRLSQLVTTTTGNKQTEEFSLAISPAWNRLVAALGNNAQIWDLSKLLEGPLLAGHTGKVTSVVFSPDGSLAVTGAADGTIRFWRADTGEWQRTLRAGDSTIESIAFSPDGRMLASGSWDNTVRLWRVADGTLLSAQRTHTGWVKSLSFSPDGATLASASADYTVILWDVSPSALASRAVLKSHTDSVNSIAFSPDGATLASASSDRTIILWDIASRKPLRTFTGFDSPLTGVAFSPDGKTIVASAQDGLVQLWRAADGNLQCAISSMVSNKNAAFLPEYAFSPDGLRVAWGTSEGTIWSWGSQ